MQLKWVQNFIHTVHEIISYFMFSHHVLLMQGCAQSQHAEDWHLRTDALG